MVIVFISVLEANAPPGPSPGPGTYAIDGPISHSTKTFTIPPSPRMPQIKHEVPGNYTNNHSFHFMTLLVSYFNNAGPGHYSPSLLRESPAYSIGPPTPSKKIS